MFSGVRYTVTGNQNLNVALDIKLQRKIKFLTTVTVSKKVWQPFIQRSSTRSSGVFILELFLSVSESSLAGASLFTDKIVCCIVARISRQFTVTGTGFQGDSCTLSRVRFSGLFNVSFVFPVTVPFHLVADQSHG